MSRGWVVACLLVAAACGKNDATTDAGGADATTDTGSGCVPCVIDTDCAGGACARLGSSSYCATTCTTACTADSSCQNEFDIAGDIVRVCVQTASITCGSPADAGLIECSGV